MHRLTPPLITMLSLFTQLSQADLVLIDENFAGFSALETYSGGIAVSWRDNDSDPTLFERYTPPSAQRQTDGDYDHDDDGGAVTPQMTLLGALEVNHNAPALTLTGQFVLPADVANNGNLFRLDFGADARGGIGFTSTVEIENITDSRFILPPVSVVYDSAPGGPDWKRNHFSGLFIPNDAGDTFEIRFTSTGDGGQGLQLTELYLNAASIPEPGIPALLGLGVVLLRTTTRRRTKSLPTA